MPYTTIFLRINACKYTVPCREWMRLIGYQQKKKSKRIVLENRWINMMKTNFKRC